MLDIILSYQLLFVDLEQFLDARLIKENSILNYKISKAQFYYYCKNKTFYLKLGKECKMVKFPQCV